MRKLKKTENVVFYFIFVCMLANSIKVLFYKSSSVIWAYISQSGPGGIREPLPGAGMPSECPDYIIVLYMFLFKLLKYISGYSELIPAEVCIHLRLSLPSN